MIQPIGYLRLWREIATKPIWLNSTPEQKTVLITLLMMANFQPKQWEWKGDQFQVGKGQFVTSIDSIVKNCGKGVTTQNVRTALKRFEKFGFLTNESTKTGRLITIENWCLYQSEEKKQQSNQQTANKELTKTSQRANKELTPREESNKDKEGEKEKKQHWGLLDSFSKELKSAYKDFITMRNSIKKPITKRSLTMLINSVDKLTDDEDIKIKILEQSIFHNWQTVYELKNNDTKNGKVVDF